MIGSTLVSLRDDVIAEPLINQWYAWSYLLPPACAARYLSEAQLPVLESFADAPQIHIDALRDPEMLGGPFVQYGAERVPEIRALLEQTRADQTSLLALSTAIANLEAILDAHPPGAPLDALYAAVPEPLKGFVELLYDGRDNPSFRLFESLLYRSDFYRSGNQSVALRALENVDQRAFVLSTPRLTKDIDLHLHRPFVDGAYDTLFSSRMTAQPFDDLCGCLALNGNQVDQFAKLVEPRAKQRARSNSPADVEVKYFGHACVLIETPDVSLLVDPLIAYPNSAPGEQTVDRYSYADLPDRIDVALITHNHQDHVMLETLLQLRHKIDRVVVPASNEGALLDPSLKKVLQQIGFKQVEALQPLDELTLPGGRVVSIPVLGEHGDLDIKTKNAYWVELLGRRIMLAADSNNLDQQLYVHLSHLFGKPDMLFIGMECEGAPYTWTYGPLLPQRISHSQAQARRLDGSDSARAIDLIKTLDPEAVYIYAMGQEPWLQFITSIDYTPESDPIKESDRVISWARNAGRRCERLFGCQKFQLEPAAPVANKTTSLPISTDVVAVKSASPSRRPDQDKSSTEKTDTSSGASKQLTSLLERLRVAGVRLSLDGEQLRVNAPRGAMDDELKNALKAAKADIISLLGQRVAESADASPAMSLSNTDDAIDWRQDARLDAKLAPTNTREIKNPQRILLTGASGFFGAFLLDALLKETNAEIVCLLRPANNLDLETRLKQTFAGYQLNSDSFESRVVTVAGDLEKPRLDLSTADYAELATSVDVIHHCGAYVHHALPYTSVMAANVNGTKEVIALACAEHAKPLQFISTLSVLPPTASNDKPRMFEDDDLETYPLPKGGYAASKWVAEQAVLEARRRGLPVNIFRLGPISGDSVNGAFNRNDFLYRLIQGYVESGMAPTGELPLDVLPVDYAATAVVKLASQYRNTNYHLLHPEAVSSEMVFDAVREAGYPMARVPYQEWYEHLTRIARDDEGHALYPLVSLFASRRGVTVSDAAPSLDVPFDTSNADRDLTKLGLSRPVLDAALFGVYINAMIENGVLSAPAKQAGVG